MGDEKINAINIEGIIAEAENLGRETEPEISFDLKSTNEWIDIAKNTPVPNRLYMEFWYEGELCFLFADSGVGKSIKAVQIADLITSGKVEAAAQKVVYFDFELSAKQFEKRYSNDYADHYRFSDDFIRAELATVAKPDFFKNHHDWFDYSFEQAVIQTGAKILIVDNITYLRDEQEKSSMASDLMKKLKNLKEVYGLSILVLGHTPKRDDTKPLKGNDLGGSKMLLNFCDSCFAIGRSFKDTNLRYLKQIKVRSGEPVYDGENVILCQIVKETNFLEFQIIGYGAEREHLKVLTQKDRDAMDSKIISLRYLSQREIAKEVGVSVGKVNKVLKYNGHS